MHAVHTCTCTRPQVRELEQLEAGQEAALAQQQEQAAAQQQQARESSQSRAARTLGLEASQARGMELRQQIRDVAQAAREAAAAVEQLEEGELAPSKTQEQDMIAELHAVLHQSQVDPATLGTLKQLEEEVAQLTRGREAAAAALQAAAASRAEVAQEQALAAEALHRQQSAADHESKVLESMVNSAKAARVTAETELDALLAPQDRHGALSAQIAEAEYLLREAEGSGARQVGALVWPVAPGL